MENVKGWLLMFWIIDFSTMKERKYYAEINFVHLPGDRPKFGGMKTEKWVV